MTESEFPVSDPAVRIAIDEFLRSEHGDLPDPDRSRIAGWMSEDPIIHEKITRLMRSGRL
jgi:hypothetical protein